MAIPMTVISRMAFEMVRAPTLMPPQVLKRSKTPIRANGSTILSMESENKNTLRMLPLDWPMSTTATGRMARDMAKEL